MLLDRRSAPFLAVGAALVLLAGGLVAVGVWWATNCFGGWVGRPLGAEVPAAASGPDRADLAAAGDLRDVGVDTTVRWGLWQHLDGIGESAKPVHRDPELRAATVADGQLVTAQRRPGSVEAVPPDTTLVAAYDAATGTPRWQVEGPRARGELRLLAVGGRLLLAAERLTALDVASGAFAWCVDAAGAAVAADAQRVVLATQDGRNSVLRSLDTATGAEQWRVGYEAHDATLRPVVTGGVVVAYVVPAGGGPSVLQAFDVAAGEPRWTAPSDPPGRSSATAIARRRRSSPGAVSASRCSLPDDRRRWDVGAPRRAISPGRGDLRGQRTVEDDSNTNVRPSPSRTRVPGSRRRLRRGGSGVHRPSSGPDT